ncbi:MAG: 4Fe-4S binding protein [Bacillota bacterium]
MPRVGVFLCHCGSNIAGTVDIDAVEKAAAGMDDVVFVQQNKYTCSEPGQQAIQQAIREHRLDRVVVAACSPRMHEKTFRRTVSGAGLNPYLLEIANVREHVSWVHHDKARSTPKAIDLVRAAVAKARLNQPLQRSEIPVEKRALVIGGGVAGIQAALDIADAGQQVILVERQQSIGGHMAQLDKTFPTLDCSACILTPKMVDVSLHPNITLMNYSEVVRVDGFVGNFSVQIKRKARYVDPAKCTGCGVCMTKCPYKAPSQFEQGLSQRKAIYVDFPQAVPNKPVIDREVCQFFKTGKCKACEKFCGAGAINWDDRDEMVTEHVGAIVVATGYDLFDHAVYGEYGYGRLPDVITGLEFERLVNASGPTGGKIKRPSDGRVPETIAWLSCVGSRDEARGKAYCSKICCMYIAKQAILFAEKVPEARPFVFYMDVRTGGKGYEEFYRRAVDEYGVEYVRGRVSRIYRRGEKLVLLAEDTLLGEAVELEADMVVLGTAVVPRRDASLLAQTLGVSYDQHGFFMEAHPKLAPVETNTSGIFLAGAAQGPKDIPESVAQASAAAMKAVSLLSRVKLEAEPTVAQVNEATCSGCGWCQPICPYKAIEMKTVTQRVGGRVRERQVASVNSSVCHGCGACTVACRSGAMNLRGFTNEQILAEVDALCL